VTDNGRWRPTLAVVQVVLAAAVCACGGRGVGGNDVGGQDATTEPPGSGATIQTVAGTGRPGDGADGLQALATDLYLPQDASVGPDGRLYVVDWNNHRVRVREADGTLRVVAGIGPHNPSDDPSDGVLNHPTSVAFDREGKMVVAAWHNSRIKVVDLATLEMTDLCGTGERTFTGDGGLASAAALNLPVAVVFNASWDMLIADQANARVRQVDHDTGVIHTIAGAGFCMMGVPCSLGDGGPATSAIIGFSGGQAARPGMRLDIDGTGTLFVADTSNSRIRKIDGAGIIDTIAGTGASAYAGDGGPAREAVLGRPADLAVAADGRLFIADTENSCVRVISPDGIINSFAGRCGEPGYAGDGGPPGAALLDRPFGVSLDSQGNVYIADTQNHRIRMVSR
jgi:hypothetical protein